MFPFFFGRVGPIQFVGFPRLLDWSAVENSTVGFFNGRKVNFCIRDHLTWHMVHILIITGADFRDHIKRKTLVPDTPI